MNDLDTLRPEVREALDRLVYFLTGTHNHNDFYTIRAELLRLAGDCAKLKAQSIYPRAQLLVNLADANERAEKAEAERAAQDAQWGGPEHDDEHSMEVFGWYILRQLNLCNEGSGSDVRKRLVKIAALAVAACESYDRTVRDYGSDG